MNKLQFRMANQSSHDAQVQSATNRTRGVSYTLREVKKILDIFFRCVTYSDIAQRCVTVHDIVMLNIKEIEYLPLAEVSNQLQVSRQTLWRWRQQGKIPSGHRFRNRQVVFNLEEVAAIKEYANRIEPINSDPQQLRLFETLGRKP